MGPLFFGRFLQKLGGADREFAAFEWRELVHLIAKVTH